MGTLSKGKKRAFLAVGPPDAFSEQSEESPPPDVAVEIALEGPTKAKKQRRAETRVCPICEEPIPLRLLGRHAELEFERVQDIMRGIGSTSVELEFEEGPSTSTVARRGAALKARKSMSTRTEVDTVEQAQKTLRVLKRNRKQRQSKLREIMAQDEELDLQQSQSQHQRQGGAGGSGNGTTWCPVCSIPIRGDVGMVDAHVDECVRRAARVQQEAEERDLQRQRDQEREGEVNVDVDAWEEYELNGETRIRLSNVSGLRGTGFHIRDRTLPDVDGEVDVDGEDEFGGAQFTERDVQVLVPAGEVLVDEGGDGMEDEDGEEDLRRLVAAGKVEGTSRSHSQTVSGSGSVSADVDVDVTMDDMYPVASVDTTVLDKAIRKARKSGVASALIKALEDKVKHLETLQPPSPSPTSSLSPTTNLPPSSSCNPLTCRICLDPYNEPTVSTGCWHTCCRECWLRCLGSTKLCPMCKRITAATELRRIYM